MSIGRGNFTSGQLTFTAQLAADTGLDPGLVAAWVYAEENGSAAQGRQAQNYHDWLNIGWADSGRTAITYAPVWNGDPSNAAAYTARWLKGTWGQQYNYVAASTIQAVLKTAGQPAAAQVKALQGSGWASSGYPLLLQIYQDLDHGLVLSLGGATAKGGIAGLGGTGTTPSTANLYQFTIGQAGNPNEDFWTGINRLASEVQWYLFGDGQYVYYMDGADLIVQTPAAYIDRIADAAVIQHLSFTWDNTSFDYASTHKRKTKVQRKARLAKVTSPTEAQMDIICPIDFYRGGDVIVFSSCGPADGRWLVSDCTRSAFSQFSSLTLVPPIMPLSEAQVAGTTGKSTGTSTVNPKTGKAASGTVAGGYVHPFPGGWSPGRLDMGYDGTFKGQIVAPFAGTITYASSSFSNWGGYVELKASGPIPGLPTDTLYFAEGISPATRSGQTVKAGQAIANAVASRWNGIVGNIEWGVAASGTVGSPTDPLAETGISDPARMVLSFSQWAQKTLGVAAPATTDHAGYP